MSFQSLEVHCDQCAVRVLAVDVKARKEVQKQRELDTKFGVPEGVATYYDKPVHMYTPPLDWLTVMIPATKVILLGALEEDLEFHFCSKDCLLNWFHDQKYVSEPWKYVWG